MDWRKIISELEAAGLTQLEIATAIDCSQAYVSQLKTTARKKPDFEIGNALIALHRSLRPARARRRPRTATA